MKTRATTTALLPLLANLLLAAALAGLLAQATVAHVQAGPLTPPRPEPVDGSAQPPGVGQTSDEGTRHGVAQDDPDGAAHVGANVATGSETVGSSAVGLNQDQADLALMGAIQPAVAVPAAPLTYTITYANLGLQTAMDATIILDLPPGVHIAGGFDGALGAVPAQASGALTTVVTVNPGVAPSGWLTFTATITTTSAEQDTANNLAVTAVAICGGEAGPSRLRIATHGNDVRLRWTPGGARRFAVWRSGQAYFQPGHPQAVKLAELSVAQYTDAGVVPVVDAEFYTVIGSSDCGQTQPAVNQVGKFSYAIQPGG